MDTKVQDFKNIPINHNEIPQSVLNIENKTRSNLFNWNGQFSPQFIEALLEKYAKRDYTIIDPFLGSGTTVSECARKGIKAYGTELNVSAFLMAKTYECANIATDERKELINKINRIISSLENNSQILDTILAYIKNCHIEIITNILSVLIVVADIYNNDVTVELINKKWNWLKNLILSLPYSKASISVERGDSRKLTLADSYADMLITSPPYINVFNYHQKYRKSVEVLGYNVLQIARSEFGANRKNRGNRFLTVIQYCIDIALSINEAIRVCKDKARMIYVVGRQSLVLGYPFCNSELIYNIGLGIFGLKLLLRQERGFKNRYGQMIYEDILHFENKKNLLALPESEIIDKAREVALKMLQEKLDIMPITKNSTFLLEAINNPLKVVQSEVAYA